MTAQRVTQSDLARELRVSRQAISKLVKAGKIEKGADGLIDVELARLALVNRVHPGSKTAAALGGVAIVLDPDPGGAPSLSAAVPDFDDAMPSTNFHAARTADMIERARITRIERQKLELELMEVNSVRAVTANLLAATRDSLLQIPARVAQVLAAEADPGRIQLTLQNELNTCLSTLASLDHRLLERAKEDLN
ncbi:hypothetical protein WAE61_18270 [Comamonadaceae bacterium PP-2]